MVGVCGGGGGGGGGDFNPIPTADQIYFGEAR